MSKLHVTVKITKWTLGVATWAACSEALLVEASELGTLTTRSEEVISKLVIAAGPLGLLFITAINFVEGPTRTFTELKRRWRKLKF